MDYEFSTALRVQEVESLRGLPPVQIRERLVALEREIESLERQERAVPRPWTRAGRAEQASLNRRIGVLLPRLDAVRNLDRFLR